MPCSSAWWRCLRPACKEGPDRALQETGAVPVRFPAGSAPHGFRNVKAATSPGGEFAVDDWLM